MVAGKEAGRRPNKRDSSCRYIFSEFENREAAWAEMTKVCGNLLGSLSRGLKQNAEWQMELLDEAKKPVFRIRLVAESVP